MKRCIYFMCIENMGEDVEQVILLQVGYVEYQYSSSCHVQTLRSADTCYVGTLSKCPDCSAMFPSFRWTPVMYGYFYSAPKVSVHGRYYCSDLGYKSFVSRLTLVKCGIFRMMAFSTESVK